MMRSRRTYSCTIRLALMAGLCCTLGLASTLDWYTGDPVPSATIGLVNGVFAGGQANVYQAFVVGAGGWTVSNVFSDDEVLPTTVITQANWQIRSGVTAGNGGTLMASGTSAATQIQIFTIGKYVVDIIEVNNLNVSLAQGEYWLSVAPVTTGTGDVSSTVPTADANAVGLPVENGMGALTFDNYPALGLNYFANPASGGRPYDWAMGIYASPAATTPEPRTFGLLTISLLAGAIAAKGRLISRN